MVMGLTTWEEHPVQNIAAAGLELPDDEPQAAAEEEKPAVVDEKMDALVEKVKAQLGERVAGVRSNPRLTDSVARLVDPEGALNPEMQRLYRMMERDFEAPKKILELNPNHPLIEGLAGLDEGSALSGLVVEQIFESALLLEGIHPDPAGMIPRIQSLMEAALKKDRQ
jgi:molecular chaperone HtpG